MFQLFFGFFANPKLILTLKYLYYASYVLVPLALAVLIWELWLQWVRALYFGKQTFVLLEIKVPREVYKSPQAAEFFMNGLYQTVGEKNWYEKWWKGQVRSWFSLEIVSIDGVVHFFIWTKTGHRAQIEANLYSQYPGIEIFEVPDYVTTYDYNPEINTLYATEFDLNNKDAYPIKTYIDYGLDRDPKEEYKIDPMTPLIEFLGSLSRGNQVWIQIILRAHKAEDKDPEGSGKLVDLKWKKAAEEEIKGIIKGAKGEVGPDGKFVPGTGRQLTELEKETMAALDRSTSKPGFDVGIRMIYTAPKDIFQITNLGGIIGGITHFNSSSNGFKPARGSDERFSHFLLAWKKRSEKKRDAERRWMLDAYKRRMYFYKPHKSPPFILNSEELATIFHFPGQVSTTPTFSRIESRKVEAPPNLPV